MLLLPLEYLWCEKEGLLSIFYGLDSPCGGVHEIKKEFTKLALVNLKHFCIIKSFTKCTVIQIHYSKLYVILSDFIRNMVFRGKICYNNLYHNIQKQVSYKIDFNVERNFIKYLMNCYPSLIVQGGSLSRYLLTNNNPSLQFMWVE